jgi:nitrate reductase gamma subunit
MHDIYIFVSGPLVWIAFILFVGGSLYQLISRAILASKKDQVVYSYMSPFFALRSIFHWIIPFGSVNSRSKPVFTIATFIFHLCLILAPVFLFAHVVLINEAWDISWWFISDSGADIMTVLVILACLFFLGRRLFLRDVKYLTSLSDYVILGLVAAPFITGFWAYHQLPGYPVMMIAHMLAGEILLAAIPFTKLSHMLFFPFTRGYIGSEFGAVRHAKDW